MKWYKYSWIVLITLIAVVACKKEKEEPIPVAPPLVMTEADIQVSYTEATINWQMETTSTIKEIVAEYATDSTFAQCEKVKMEVSVDTKNNITTCKAVLKDLTVNTQYFIRFRAVNKYGSLTSPVSMFTTEAYHLPQVQLDSIRDVTIESATFFATLTDWGTDTMPELGFCFAEHANVSIEDMVTPGIYEVAADTVVFSWPMGSLPANTTFYVRAYASNGIGIKYSEEKSFTTIDYGMPVVNTNGTSEISITEATAYGDVKDAGGARILERGICYGLQPNPTLSDSVAKADYYGIGDFSCLLTNLTENTTYHYRAYATNTKGTTYGEDKTFTTLPYSVPTVSTMDIDNVWYTSASIGGLIENDGGLEITECGIYYSLLNNPSVSGTKVQAELSQYAIMVNKDSLQPNTTYYACAYAVNSKGVGYGDVKSFTTKAYPMPSVTTDEAPTAEVSTAICCGQITYDSDVKPIKEFGICYSATNSNPTVSDSKVTKDDNDYQNYCCLLTELQPGTTYYVRAFATTDVGTAYGKVVPVMTQASAVPTLTTGKVSNITPSSASCTGNVINQGNSPVIERGICYSTSTNPTVNDNVVSSGSGTGLFVVNMTKLTHETTYYIRAYAKNNQGVGYGNEVSFTTDPYSEDNRSKIKYSAASKLPEVTSISQEGIHPDAFDGPILAHEFANGVGYITFGGQITTIGNNAFRGATMLLSLDSLPWSITSIGNYAFYECTSMTYANLNNTGIVVIGSDAFSGCVSLQDYDIPWKLAAINDRAFYDCTSLRLVYMWENVKTIGDEAFYNCKVAAPINIGAGVTSIGSKAFYKCSGTDQITVAAPTPPTCASDAFDDFNRTLYVPSASVDAYKAADTWKKFTNIIAHPNL